MQVSGLGGTLSELEVDDSVCLFDARQPMKQLEFMSYIL